MKRAVAVMGVLGLGLVGVVGSTSLAGRRDGPPRSPSASASLTGVRSCQVSTWPLRRRVGQLLFASAELSDLGASAPLAAGGVGGFVLFGQPAAGSGPAIRSGIASLDAAAAGHGQTRPWLATDEEGGAVQRLAAVVGSLPAPRTMAATMTPTEVRASVAAVARRMAALGVGVDLAPVLDTAPVTDTLADEDQRSFSDRASVATRYGEAFVAGLEAGGVVPVVKHFPGLGHASADTDLRPAVDPPLAALQGRDLLPFAAAADRGVPVVMIGHPVVPGLTGGKPASLAPAAYAYLRQRLGYPGLVVTDALGAGAISAAGYSEATAAVRAVESGADMVLVDAGQASGVERALLAAVRSGRLPAATVDRAVGLVLAAKGATPCSTRPPPGCGAGSRSAHLAAAVADPAVPGGYWDAYADGCVTAHGGAPALGSYHGRPLSTPVVGLAPVPGGRGYWLATAGGRVLAFGTARPQGSAVAPATPVTGIAAAAGGRGYWLLEAGGRVLPFGAAPAYRRVGAVTGPASRATAIAARPGGGGFWVLRADGTVTAYGGAPVLGGGGAAALPETSLVAAGPGGYWVVSESGRVTPRGAARSHGEGSRLPTSTPTVGLVAEPGGYALVLASGQAVPFT